MTVSIVGTWTLTSWRRIDADGNSVFPLGKDAIGVLIYAEDGRMAVQMAANHRPVFVTSDPLNGPIEARAQAYSTFLAYSGTYEVTDQFILHKVEASLNPNWSNTEQKRPFNCDGQTLILFTPPSKTDDEIVVNEMAWRR